MKLEEFVQIIANAEDKVSVLADKENINRCENITFDDLEELMEKFLIDNEKVDTLKLEHIKNNVTIRNYIIQSLKTDEAKVKLAQDKELLELYKDDRYLVTDMMASMDEASQVRVILENTQSLKEVMGSFSLAGLVGALDAESLSQIVTNKETVSALGLSSSQLSDVFCKLSDDNLKLELTKKYEFNNVDASRVIQSINDDLKLDVLKGKEYSFNEYDARKIITGMSAQNLIHVISHDKALLDKYNIEPHSVISALDDEKQVQVIQSLDKLGLETNDKRKCIAVLSENVKSQMDREGLEEEVRDALDTVKDKKGKIVVDFNDDLGKYAGLDELIKINPLKLNSNESQKFKELARICPNMSVVDDLVTSESTAQEYLNAEAWIEEVEAGINPEWSDVEKIAYIDNAIGKKVSYAPDLGTEACDESAVRSLWKIIDSGYGVCNGISQVEQYMLGRIGIESERISGKHHSFLKIPNLKVKCADGEVKTGSSILDPTWNLAEQRYGARPDNFLRSYEEIRKHDVRRDGTDAECHKNDEKLSDATLDIDDKTLRQIYTNIGVITRVDSKFPVTDIMEESEKIDKLKLGSKTSVKKQLELLEKMHPDFATCQNSTDVILKGVLLAGENLQYDKMIMGRVFDKNDEMKKAVQYVYMELPDQEKVFFWADAKENKFKEASEPEFEERFRCYESDLSLNKR